MKGYDGLDGIELVMDRGSRASQVIDLVNLQEDGLNDVVPNELEIGVSKMVKQVILPSGEEIVDHNHAIASLNQTIHQVASDETGPTGHHNPLPLTFQTRRHLPAFSARIRRRSFLQ